LLLNYSILQDGLFLVQNHPETVKNYQKAVLTPNVVEFKRLCETMVILFCECTDNSSSVRGETNTFFFNQKLKFDDKETDKMAERLSNAFGGVTIVQKGPNDIISNGKEGKGTA
jgi:ATP-dependent NAD(P)H-hydrate dehydratase